MRGGAQVADVAAATRLCDGEAADLLAGQRRTHPAVDLVGITGCDQVREGDAAGEQRREDAAGSATVEELLFGDHRVDDVTAGPADLLGHTQSEQPQLCGLDMQFTRDQALVFPSSWFGGCGGRRIRRRWRAALGARGVPQRGGERHQLTCPSRKRVGISR